MRLLHAAGLVALVFSTSVLAEAGVLIKRTKDPALSPDGSTIAFVWQGDVWTVGHEGGEAKRLTVNPADDGSPVWTPDGTGLVFHSNRYGNFDLFFMKADGSGLRRLTWDSSNEYPNAVAPDGTIYGYSTQWGRIDLFRLAAGGGDLVRISEHPLEMEYYADISPDGRQVVFNTAGSPGHWRKPGHSGSNTAEVWVAEPGTPLRNMRQVTKNDHLDMFPRYLDANTVVTMSNPGGIHNLHKVDLRNGRATKVTNFASGTIRAVTVSRTAGRAAFQRNSAVYTTDLGTGRSQEVEIFAPEDARRNPVQEFRLTSGASDGAVSPDGRLMVIAVRGDLFLLPAGGGTTRRLTTNVRPDTNPRWIDDKTIAYVAAGDNGQRSLWTVTIEGETKELYRDSVDAMTMEVSPDRKWVAFHRGNREICVMPAGGGASVMVAEGDFSSAFNGSRAFSWSPDSEWLVYQSQETRSVGQYLVRRNGTQRTLVGRVGKYAGTPEFSPDGKRLIYAGVEGLDYSETRSGGSPGYILDLVPPAVTFSEDDLDKLGQEPPKPGPAKVEFDLKGIEDRRRRLSFENLSGYWPMASGDGWYAMADGQFVRIDGATGRGTPVPGVTGNVFAAIDTGKGLYIVQSAGVGLVANNAVRPVRFEAVMRVDMAAEETALFEDAWWALDRMFYDAQMHGKDWGQVRQEFAALVPFVTSRDDFYELMGEMVERLDSSHQGATSPDPYRSPDAEQTAWLGVEWDWAQVERGAFVVAKVYPGTPAAHPQMALMPGDRVVSVDGVVPGSGQSMAELLRGKAGRKVLLSVERGGRTIEVEFKPTTLSAFTGSAYDAWVKWNKAETARLSNGRLGYIHIQGMNNPSLDTWLREIATELEGKDGVIVDVRYNGGGYTAHIILNIMRKEPWMIRTERALPGVKFSENQYRGNALELPSAAMTNEYSFSNAEIFSEGFQRLGLGPVVGERTGGGVIGTGAYGLWDGGSIRMPGSGAFTVDMVNLERDGRKPTVNVDWDPVAWQTGRDTQLERAVQELMRRLR